MPTVYWDVETYCDLSLTEHGAYLYARHSSTCPLVLGYAVDADEVRTWAPDDPPPAIFLEAAEHPNDFWSVSDNWTFENLILEYVLIPRHGFRPLPIERQDCAQRLALANGYPAELGLRCEALGLPYRKDPEARRAMLRISRPKTAKSRRKAENTEQYQADLALVIERCKTDVASTRAAYNAPQLTRLSADERQVLLVDAAINRRGIRANIPFLTAAREMTVRERNNINARLDELTCGAINSVDQRDRILKAVNERGHHLSSLTKRSVAAALAHQPDNYVQELLTLRQQGAFASVRKFKTFLNFADPEDRRVRDTLRYCGSATGRWSSLKPQLQNLKRNDAELPAFLVDAIIAGNRDTLVRFGNPLTLMGELSRAGLCADSGNVLMSGDLSAIESRILSWKAGEQWKLDSYAAFDRSGDKTIEPYRVVAHRMLRKTTPISEITTAERQMGKAADLGLGFGGSIGAWRKISVHDPRTDAEIGVIVRQWRDAHPAITRFWKELARAIRVAIRVPGQPILVAPAPRPPITALFAAGNLTLTLPSGRAITYPQARLVPNRKFEDADPDVEFMDNARGQWKPVRGWFGTFVENVVQGCARDLLAAALVRFEARGLPVVHHAHDEVTIEVPEGSISEQETLAILLEPPAWATGLPLGGKVRTGLTYLDAPATAEPPQPNTEEEIVEAAVDAFVADMPELVDADGAPIDPKYIEKNAEDDFLASLGETIAPLTELVTLPMNSSNHVCCPFHEEVEPSCKIYADHFHCLSGETKVMTWNGNVPIAKLAGGIHRLLTTGGDWINAPVKSFGTQRLWRISLSRNGVRKDLYTTDEHRWFVHGRAACIITKDLRTGQRLEAVFPKRNEIKLDAEGVRHGIVFGDGTMDSNRNGLSCVNLWGEKGPDLRGWFNEYPQRDPHYRQDPHVEIRRCPGRYKTLPPLEATPEYLAGFLAGYLATDGCVSTGGTVALHCADSSVLEYVRLIGARLGIGTHSVTRQMRVGYGVQPSAIYRIHFASEQMWTGLFIRSQAATRFASAHKAYARHRWQVRSVEPTDRIEEVYCAQVPNTAAFALEDNILTGNCYGCGMHGDRLAWLTKVEGMTTAEAMAALQDSAVAHIETAAAKQSAEDKYAYLMQLWTEARALIGSPAERYLRDTRGIDTSRLPASIHDALRFHPRCPFGANNRVPCLIALMRNPLSGAPVGLHRTALKRDADGRIDRVDRKMFGKAGVVQLWPINGNEQLVVGEGLETTLAAAVHVPYRGAPLTPAWSALTAGGLKCLPVLPGVSPLILLVDNDENGEGQRAAEQCRRAWKAAGRIAVPLIPKQRGWDFNDVVFGRKV